MKLFNVLASQWVKMRRYKPALEVVILNTSIYLQVTASSGVPRNFVQGEFNKFS